MATASTTLAVVLFIVVIASISVVQNAADATHSYEQMEQSADYIIYKNEGSTLAKNGITGNIDFSSINATYVIQSAVNAGGNVYLKEGTYVLDWNINITRSSTIMSGAGAGTVLYLEDGYSVASKNPWQPATIRVGNSQGGASNVVLRDFTINGNAAGQIGGAAAIGVYKSYNCLIENVYIHDIHGGSAISLQDTHDSRISGCTIEDIGTSVSWGNGIATGSRFPGTICSNITIESCYISGATNNGIDIEPGRDISIIGNTIVDTTHWSANKTNGIYFGNPEGFPNCDNVLITNNFISGTEAIGIQVRDTEHLTISDNKVGNTGSSGVYVYRCSGFIITSNDVSFNQYTGIYVVQSANGVIGSNYCDSNNAGGGTEKNIAVASDSTHPATHITIMNNRCIGAYRGLSCTGDGCDYIIAIGNVLTGFTGTNYVNGANSIKANNIGV